MSATVEQTKTHRETMYFVNGKPQETTEHKLTVRAILEHAGFAPAEQYQLVRDEGHHVFTNPDEEIPVHKGERFTALFQGPTPVS